MSGHQYLSIEWMEIKLTQFVLYMSCSNISLILKMSHTQVFISASQLFWDVTSIDRVLLRTSKVLPYASLTLLVLLSTYE